MTAAGRTHRHHRQSQYTLAVALAALGLACLVAATQLASPSPAQPAGAHLALSSSASAAQAGGAVDPPRRIEHEVLQDPVVPPTSNRITRPDSARDAALQDRVALGRGATLDLPTWPDTSSPPPRATSPASSSPPGPQPTPHTARPSTAPLPASIEIPSIDVRSDLVVLGLDDEGRLEVPREPDVAGWYAGGPRPGEYGAAVIVGHIDWTDGPAVFWRLPQLSPGDHVVVHGSDGTARDFVVDRLERWPKAEFPTDLVYHDADGTELRLVTCGGPFDEAQRSYRDNIIVFATLASPT